MQTYTGVLEVSLITLLFQAKGTRALITATNHVMAWEGCGNTRAVCPPWTLLSKFVNRNQTAIFMCPVVCLDVFKELFEVQQLAEIEWINSSEQVNFSLGFPPQNYSFHCPSFGLWACSPENPIPTHGECWPTTEKLSSSRCLPSIANYRIRKEKSIF